jgi:hypothetical protein
MIKNQIFKFRETALAPAGNPNPIRVRGQKKQGVVAQSKARALARRSNEEYLILNHQRALS